MFGTLTYERPVGSKDGDVLTHCLYGHAAHHSEAGWVFPPVFNVLTLFTADYKYHAPNAALRKGGNSGTLDSAGAVLPFCQ